MTFALSSPDTGMCCTKAKVLMGWLIPANSPTIWHTVQLLVPVLTPRLTEPCLPYDIHIPPPIGGNNSSVSGRLGEMASTRITDM